MNQRGLIAMVVIVLSLTSCEDAKPRRETRSQNATSPGENKLFRFAAQHLPDRTLDAVAPAGFNVYEIKRYGRERHDQDWITVGARMEGPVPFARAIFYIHPNSTAARRMHERQVELTGWKHHDAGGIVNRGFPEPFRVPVGAGSFCGVRADLLYWCHSVKGRVNLLIQSSARKEGASRGTVDAKKRDDAVALITAFGSYLRDEVP
jgi:hypothetical protein